MDGKLHEGNMFFKHKYPTISIENMLRMSKSFEEFEKLFSNDLMNENLLLGLYLNFLLDKYNFTPTNVSGQIGKSESYVRKIVASEKLNPSRDVLLAICVRIGATVEETQILLRYAGKAPLYARRKRDVIIWFALSKGTSLEKLDCYLAQKGYLGLYTNIGQKEK